MKVSLWAEIRRLHEIEGLSQRAIARRMRCSPHTVKRAIVSDTPPGSQSAAPRPSLLDPHKPKIVALVEKHPELSAVRILEEIRRGPDAYQGGLSILRQYVRSIRPDRRRVYQEVAWEPGQALQVDWGCCGQVEIESTTRKVSVLVAVLCYSRMCYIEFTLSQKKAEFYRAIVHALEFFGGSPRRIIFDNLKAAVLNGSGRNVCLQPEFYALCGHYALEPVACASRDPESKGMVEAGVRYVKRNALAGRSEELTSWEDYGRLARSWRDETANIRMHRTLNTRPIDRFEEERPRLRPLPAAAWDADEIVPTVATSHALVRFDGNKYSVPVDVARRPVVLRAGSERVRIFCQEQEVAQHRRSYGRNVTISQPEHELQARLQGQRQRASQLGSALDGLGPAACQFHLCLQRQPVKTSRHVRRLLCLVRVYGREDVVQAIEKALEYETYDAAYVETLLLQERRRRELPSPTPLCPQRRELIEDMDLEEPDPAWYERLCDPPVEENSEEGDDNQANDKEQDDHEQS
jgi:transposase